MYTHTHTHTHTHTPHLSAVQLPKPVAPLLQLLSQWSEGASVNNSNHQLVNTPPSSLRTPCNVTLLVSVICILEQSKKANVWWVQNSHAEGNGKYTSRWSIKWYVLHFGLKCFWPGSKALIHGSKATYIAAVWTSCIIYHVHGLPILTVDCEPVCLQTVC